MKTNISIHAMARSPLRQRLLTMAGAAWLLLAATSAHAQTLQNASFENPALRYGNYASGAGDNWGYAGSAYVITNDYSYGNTPYGSQWELLIDSSASVTQTIASGFLPNTTYTLSVQASDIFDSNLDTLTMVISGAATASATYALPGRAGGYNTGDLSFAKYTVDFTPLTSDPVTISLLSSNDNGGSIALDDVELTEDVPEDVPEPSTWALLGSGAVGLGLTLRRRATRA